MQLAYIDEVGETGAFVGHDDRRYNTSAAFGYAGFVIPAESARRFGAIFQREKRTLFRREIEAAEHPGRWERKGAEVFRPQTWERYPEQIRVFNGLVRRLRDLDGRLFYYADEKPLGTPRQTALDPPARETAAMRETLNRLARNADGQHKNLMVLIDQINERTRSERLPVMYSHILGRAEDHPEMRRIIEPPMHVDSVLSANIQFADWVAACVSRAIDYQLVVDSRQRWVVDPRAFPTMHSAFTHESKLHLWQRAVADLNNSDIFDRARRVHPSARGHLVGAGIDPAVARRIKAAAERARQKPTA